MTNEKFQAMTKANETLSETMKDYLLLCPFCGQDPETSIHVRADFNGGGCFFSIKCFCKGMVARAYQMGGTLDEAIANWNTRFNCNGTANRLLSASMEEIIRMLRTAGYPL